MSANDGNFTVDGRVRFTGENGVTEFTATTAEGTRELLEFPIQSVISTSDSVFFSFAPIGYRLRGRCVSPANFEGTFTVPQPPFEDISGRWTLSRER